MFWRSRIRWYTREWAAAALFLAIVVAGAAIFRSQWRPSSYRLVISAGSVNGLRHRIAERLAEDAAAGGLSLRIVGTRGSLEALNRVDSGELDLALVQGGLDPKFHPNVRQVAALHVEPMHLLVNEEIRAQVTGSLSALRGMRVNIGPLGSGTHDLAIDILRVAGLVPRGEGGEGDYIAGTFSYDELKDKVRTDQRPHAIFTVSALPSPVVRSLTLQHYRLVPLPFGEAYALDTLNRRDLGGQPDSTTGRNEVAKVYIYPTQIPAFTYGIDPPNPPTDLPTFGPRLLMVARKDVAAGAIRKVLETVFSAGFARISRPPLDAKLLENPPEYELHPGTQEYLEYNKPVMAGDVIDLLEKACSLAGAILGAMFFLWQWFRQRYRRMRDLGFESYLVKVAAIEERMLAFEMEARLDIGELLRLQQELLVLKNEALRRFAEGKLQGGDVLSGFISHVNDARNYLNRLILHERDNLEDRAIIEKRPAEAIWTEALGESHAASRPQGSNLAGLARIPPNDEAYPVVDDAEPVPTAPA